MQNLVIQSEARQNLDQDQQVDDEVVSAARGLWPTRRAGIESQERVKLEHVSHALPLLAMDGNVSRPPRPEITSEKPVDP